MKRRWAVTIWQMIFLIGLCALLLAPVLAQETLAPTATAIVPGMTQPASGDNTGIFIITLVFIVIAIVGIATLFFRRRRG